MDRGGLPPFPGIEGERQQSGQGGLGAWRCGQQDSFNFLAPSAPVNVFGMAHNTGQPGRDLPPQAFHKAASSVIGPGEAIQLSSTVGYVDPEAELTVVVGRARGV